MNQHMPKNKSEKINNQQNLAEFAEEAITLKPNKATKRPPNLNNINKNEQ